MKLRRKTALAVVLLGIAAAVIWVLVFRLGEARYDGKPARFWVRQLIEKRDSTFSRQTDEVAQLRRIGAPAVRCLMDAIRQKGYVRGTPAYSNLYVRLSPRLTHHLPAPVDPMLVQIRAYWALEALGPLAKPAARLLAERVVDEKNKLRSFSTHALGAVGTNAVEVVPVLLGGLKHTNREIWSAAGEMLLRLDPENHAALTRLGAGLESSDVVSRRMAAYALGQESPLGPEAERCLLTVLGDDDVTVRFRAAMALFSCYPTNQHYEALLLDIDRSPKATFGMLMDVARIRPATAETTKLLFESYKLHGRRSSGYSYYEDYFRNFSGQDSNAVPALIEALGETQNPKVRALAAQALGQIGPPAAPAIPSLREAAQSDNDDARQQAIKALERIASRDTGKLLP